MALLDPRGLPVTGADPQALDDYERALSAWRAWRSGSDVMLARVVAHAPGFVIARLTQAWQACCSRDPARVRSASRLLEALPLGRMNPRERGHLAGIRAVLADDYQRAQQVVGTLLDDHPRDLLAMLIAHALDYALGDLRGMAERVHRALPAWPATMPGRSGVLAMLAFSLAECGRQQEAADAGLQAIAADPLDARAHHALAHVFEMTGRPDAGIRWLVEQQGAWAESTIVGTHLGWHLALFRLARGEADAALVIYDQHVRRVRSAELGDLIDASALMWRLELAGASPGPRWQELAAAWAPRIGDRFCTFNDLHAMLALVGARDWDNAQALERELARRRFDPGRHGQTTRQVGLAACRGIIAFGRGDHAGAVRHLAKLPASVVRMGGSHAQRDVVYATLAQAIERLRRPAWRIAA